MIAPEIRRKKAAIVPEGQRRIARDKRGCFMTCFAGHAPSLDHLRLS
jgi:hypothetical protein